MRLIDANALRLMKVEECAGHSIEYAMGWKACIEWIKDAPTIDAIPMDWMDNQIHGYASRLQSTELKALLIVSRLWEKDQEGKS